MKKILILTSLLIITATCCVIGQEINAQNYKHTPETKKFEGTWEFKDTNSSISFVLKNYEKLYLKSIPAYMDVIQGNITYIKHGKIIFNNEKVITNGMTGEVMPFELWGTYREPEGNRGRLILTFKDPTDLNTLNLKIVPGNELKAFKMPNLKTPEELVLKKVKK